MRTESLAMSVSLLHGWLPLTVQAVAAAALVVAIGWRSRRWRLLSVPAGLAGGLAAALLIRWLINYHALAGDPAPLRFWLWIVLSGLAVVVLLFGWRRQQWWRRGISVVAVPLCLLCVALALNLWVAYFPTVKAAWDRATGAPLPSQTDLATVAQMQRMGAKPTKGTIVSVRIPDTASGFKHRDELVYLPPWWFASNPPPRLPVVMMMGGEFGHPKDWLGAGAGQILDDFVTKHGGNGPVIVFADITGSFLNDTECVNGTRGNAADHLTKDIVPYMISNFGVSADAANWGLAGWSAGGTCALTLTVKYPQLFSTFVDIDGQAKPNAGTRQQTIYRLFGGDEKAWAEFDPKTVMERHGRYMGVSAWFGVSDATSLMYRTGSPDNAPVEVVEPQHREDQAAVARHVCALASNYGIECAVVGHPDGNHDFRSGAVIFASALPWLAGRLGTPGVPRIPLPGAPLQS